MDDLLRLSKTAWRLGMHPVTFRAWADTGKIPVVWRERRFGAAGVEAMKVMPGGERIRLEGLHVRVSGARGQELSLAAQEADLRATPAGEVARVFGDRASGLREDRPGLSGLLAVVGGGSVTVVRVSLPPPGEYGGGFLLP